MKKLLATIVKNGAFLLSILLCWLFITLTVINNNHMEKLTMEQLIKTKSTRLTEVISRLVYKTNALSALAIRGYIVGNDFDLIAANIVDDPAFEYVLVAPGGIVSNVYPLKGNEHLIGINIMEEGLAADEAVLAMESGQLVLGGPYDLAAGGQALIARLPLYNDDKNGGNEFWGLVSVALKYPEVMDTVDLEDVQLQGFAYEVYKLDPVDGREITIAGNKCSNDIKKSRIVEEEIDILNAVWFLRVYDKSPWYTDGYVWFLALICSGFCAMVAVLQKVTEKAKNAAKSKSDFLASMSHEIRTPMNAIIGMSELLAMEDLTQRQKEYVNDINLSSTNLLGIINDILDVSKIEAGKLEIRPHSFDLLAFVENVCSVMAYSVKEQSIEFVSEVTEPIPSFVYGDDLRMRQILLNVLGNAVKFTEEGYVKFFSSYSDGNIHFKVEDTGIGIKEANIGRLFDSFEQFDSKKNRWKQGTGLGLSITKSLVTMMGGKIDVHSIYGKGTTFDICIPLPQCEGEKDKACADDFEYINAKEANILLAEDNEINRKVAAGLFKLFEITCDIAANGAEAVEKVKEKDYDIVFMDHMMPVMDGIEATEAIRAMGGKYSQGKLAIIALTANVLPESRQMFTACGMDDFLAKPIDKLLLNKMLKKWLPNNKQKKSALDITLTNKIPEKEYSPALVKACTIDGLDVALGLSHVSSMEDYERSLRLLNANIPQTAEHLRHFLEEGELEKFAIEVHGMKGALAINGHTFLSEIAQMLEAESKNGNFQYCATNFPEFSAKLKHFGDALDDIFKRDNIAKQEGSVEILADALEDVENSIDTFNREGALEALEKISGFSFGADTDTVLEQLTYALENFDFDIAAQLMQNIDL